MATTGRTGWWCRGALALVLASGAMARAQSDSSAILFSEDAVRQYAITFYQTGWDSTLKAMWAADSGYLPARFTDGNLVLDSVGVRYKGNSSFTLAGNNPKKPLKVKFNEFKSQTYYGIKTLNFSNGIGDPTMLRERIGYAIARRLGPAPRATFAQISIDGTPIGLYTQVEQADKTFLKRWYADATGNLFKAGDDGAPLVWEADSTTYSTSGTYELKTNETLADWSGFVRFVDFLNNPTDSVFCAERDSFLDDENVARFLAFNTVLSSFDSYNGSGRNWYAYQKSASGAMDMIPWDLNLAFGAYGGASNALSIAIDTVQAPMASRPLFRRAMRCAPLRAAYFKWVRVIAQTEASTDSVLAMMVRDSALIAPFVEADANKFYPLAAWKTNLRANYRATEGLIPGLVSFSSSRNASVLAQVANLAPETIATQPRAAARSWSVVRRRDGWQLQGLETVGAGVVRWATPDGRSVGERAFEAGSSSIDLPLPRGLVVVSVRTAQGLQSTLLLQSRK